LDADETDTCFHQSAIDNANQSAACPLGFNKENDRAMTIKHIEPPSADDFFKVLEGYAKKFFIFRGHRRSDWRLSSTLNRHHNAPYNPRTSWEIDEMLRQFLGNLRMIGIVPPYTEDLRRDTQDLRRERLEFGRHYGVPSPLIDFSYSPYMATFFAFSGVRPYDSTDADRAAIYCLNVFELAGVWARIYVRRPDGSIDGQRFTVEHNNFIYEQNDLFQDGYPASLLKFVSTPASWNRRMRRQVGCFLYDSLPYPWLGHSDLEHLLTEEKEIRREPQTGEVMLTKVFLPHRQGRDVLQRLDLMGISATHLYDSHEGAAIDVVNSYNYDRKMGHVWDLRLPPPLAPDQ
jgi:FRG domain